MICQWGNVQARRGFQDLDARNPRCGRRIGNALRRNDRRHLCRFHQKLKYH